MPQDLWRAGSSPGGAGETGERAGALPEGVGLRATERLVGASHNAVMNWGREAVAGKKNGLLVGVGY